jgi:hypothetical protein
MAVQIFLQERNMKANGVTNVAKNETGKKCIDCFIHSTGKHITGLANSTTSTTTMTTTSTTITAVTITDNLENNTRFIHPLTMENFLIQLCYFHMY